MTPWPRGKIEKKETKEEVCNDWRLVRRYFILEFYDLRDVRLHYHIPSESSLFRLQNPSEFRNSRHSNQDGS